MAPNPATEQFFKLTNCEKPIICGPMYPCSNPELVAAASESGAIGIVQPLALTFVFGYEFRAGLRKIRSLTSKPIGLNALIEATSQKYLDRQKVFIDIALEEGVRFFLTSLGNPDWVVKKVKAYGGVVFHDVTELKWAKKAMDAGVDGLVCVNNRAGGHAGGLSAQQLFNDVHGLGLPLVCAGGVGSREEFKAALEMGYAAVQMGTRFIASRECSADQQYKQAILNASQEDIVLSEKLTGVPVAVINTDYIKKIGIKAGPLAKFLLGHPKGKHWMRSFYSIRSFFKLKKTMKKPNAYDIYYQAGKSVEHIDSILSVKEIVDSFTA